MDQITMQAAISVNEGVNEHKSERYRCCVHDLIQRLVSLRGLPAAGAQCTETAHQGWYVIRARRNEVNHLAIAVLSSDPVLCGAVCKLMPSRIDDGVLRLDKALLGQWLSGRGGLQEFDKALSTTE